MTMISRIHARQDRELLQRLDDAGRAAQVVKPGVHHDAIDGVHLSYE